MNCSRAGSESNQHHSMNGKPAIVSATLWSILALLAVLPGIACGQIFFIEGNAVEEYSLSGKPINTDLIPIPTQLGNEQVAVEGNDLFLLNGGGVSEYTTGGQLLNSDFIQRNAFSMAVSGGDIFLGDLGGHNQTPAVISEYTTSGILVNGSIGTANPTPENLAVSGDEIFTESDSEVFGAPVLHPNSIGEFSISGGSANPAIITANGTFGIAVVGGDLFATNFDTETIQEYTTSGTLLSSSFITVDSGFPVALTSSGDDLFASISDGTAIAEYTTSGTTISDGLITGLPSEVTSIAVEVPEPGTVGLLVFVGGVLLSRGRGRLNA